MIDSKDRKTRLSRQRKYGRIRIRVTKENIELGIPETSSYCMIAEAVKDCLGRNVVKRVAVDLRTVRFTDGDYRYVYLTPDVAARALVDFDRGIRPEPFEFELRTAIQVRSQRLRGTSSSATTEAGGEIAIVGASTPVVLGGRTPRRAPLSTGTAISPAYPAGVRGFNKRHMKW